MKIKELVNLAQRNKDLMEMEISIALGPDEQKGGILDGTPAILFNPVKTAIFGGEGILLFANQSIVAKQAYVPGRLSQFPQAVIFGPIPDFLK
jgi:hypothetical protein